MGTKRLEEADEDIAVLGEGTPVSTEAPAQLPFGLSQNYPNPFRGTTRLCYTLARPGRAEVRVYDLLGRHVRTVFEGWQDTGEHRATMDLAGLPAGVYLYELRVGARVSRRAMTLVR